MINKSKAYISPLVLDDIQDIPFQAVKNTFIFSDFSPLEPQLYVLVDKDSINLENLSKYSQIEDIFSIGEQYVLVMKLDSKFNYEYLCFKRGNYSWYTADAKRIIVRYLTNNISRRSLSVVDKIRSVFARDPMLKEFYEHQLDIKLDENAELGTRMVDEEETFKSSEYGEFKQVKRETSAG